MEHAQAVLAYRAICFALLGKIAAAKIWLKSPIPVAQIAKTIISRVASIALQFVAGSEQKYIIRDNLQTMWCDKR
jgi:hypothetical protein